MDRIYLSDRIDFALLISDIPLCQHPLLVAAHPTIVIVKS